MIGTGRRRLAPLLLMATLAGAARAETQLYDVSLGSLRVGVLELTTGADSARLLIQSAGLVRAVRFEAEVSGTDPRHYEEQADTGRRISQVRIEWQNDRPQVLHYAATPPETAPPPDAGATQGTLDPVSALVAVLGDTRTGDACRLSLHLFDGQRLSRLDLTGRDDTPGGLSCTGAFTRLQGYRPEDMAERRRFALRVTYLTGETGGLMASGAEVQTLYGKLRLKRR